MRSCGECTECCTRISVEAISKPKNVRCQYLCEGGCGIYATRPRACSSWKCGWLMGHGEDHDRPDLSGVIVDWGNLGKGEEDGPPLTPPGLYLTRELENVSTDAMRRTLIPMAAHRLRTLQDAGLKDPSGDLVDFSAAGDESTNLYFRTLILLLPEESLRRYLQILVDKSREAKLSGGRIPDPVPLSNVEGLNISKDLKTEILELFDTLRKKNPRAARRRAARR